MRIRNEKACDLYLPYAGKRRGFVVKAGKLSMDLPTDRFYDPLLQRDWRMGKISVLLSDADKAVLGPVAEELPSETVVVDDGKVMPAAEKKIEELPAPTPVKPRAKKKAKGKKTDKSIKPTGNGIRLYTLAKELGVSSRSVIAEMRRRGLEPTGAVMVIDPELAEELRVHFQPPKPDAVQVPQMTRPEGPPMAAFARGLETPTPTKSTADVPSLADLQDQNAKLDLTPVSGMPDFNGPTTQRAVIEKPAGDLFGSALSAGPPGATVKQPVTAGGAK